MATICPTVLAENPHQFREQVERVAAFAIEIHLDFADGSLTDTKTVELSQAWWPHSMRADLHLMMKNPSDQLETILPLNPRRVIVHAEADLDFIGFADQLHQAGIEFGIALQAKTGAEVLRPYLEVLDHVLIFSGHLGHFGGEADLELLDKVNQVKKLKHDISIGWDGGVNADNARRLADGGVDILNVGGFIQHGEDPHQAYQDLERLLQ